ncbi:MAG TPA: PilZ domain-containing protein [Polyangiales bacterium]
MRVEAMRKRRRSVRRAVSLECALQCELWDDVVHLPASNLSTDGIWIETPISLDPGQELIVSFTPPGAPQRVWAAARVVRNTGGRMPKGEPQVPGMALAFTYCSDEHRSLLEQSLYGQPPRLPNRRVPPPLPTLECSVRSIAAIKIVSDATPEITHGPAPREAIEATVIAPPENTPGDLARATMQVMDEELRVEEVRANATIQVLDDELVEN